MLQDPETGKATRVRFETKDGKKVRIAVKIRKRNIIIVEERRHYFRWLV